MTTKTTSTAASKKTKYERIDWAKADDQALIAAILDRDNLVRSDRAWHELFARYDATINKRLRWTVGNCARMFRASDTFQDCKAEFFAALLWRDGYRLRAFDPKKGSLKAWLSKIAHQTALTYLTKLVRDGVPDPIEAIEADDCDAGYGEEDRDVGGNGQIGARWIGVGAHESPSLLLTAIADAELTIVDEKRRLVFAWFGGEHVHVFDADGDQVHRFTVRDTSEASIRAAVDRVRHSGRLDR